MQNIIETFIILGIMVVNAVESGRERTTLTDSRIKLVLSDRLFKSHFVRWG